MTSDGGNNQQLVPSERQHRVDDQLTILEGALRAHGISVDADAFARARCVLDGSLTREQARAQIAAKYDLELPGDS